MGKKQRVLLKSEVYGPSTSLSFLGVILDAATMSVKLPEDKLNSLQTLLDLFLRSKMVQDQRSLQSLVGHLVHMPPRSSLWVRRS